MTETRSGFSPLTAGVKWQGALGAPAICLYSYPEILTDYIEIRQRIMAELRETNPAAVPEEDVIRRMRPPSWVVRRALRWAREGKGRRYPRLFGNL